MIINIIAPTGGSKTKTALEIASFLGLSHDEKVVYLTSDIDYTDWIPHIESIVGKEKLSTFRPVYAKDLESVKQIAPYVDRLPYDIIILDGFALELAKLSSNEFSSLINFLEGFTTNNSGKIIVTMQSNNF